MPFDPAKPANNAALNSAEMRGQLTSRHSALQTRASRGQLAGEIGGTSANSNGVGNLSLGVSDPPTQGEAQAIADKLDELINALRR